MSKVSKFKLVKIDPSLVAKIGIFKAQPGLNRDNAWSRWIIEQGLKPGMDAAEFYHFFDRVTPQTESGGEPGEALKYSPEQATHFIKSKGSNLVKRVALRPDDYPGKLNWFDVELLIYTDTGVAGSDLLDSLEYVRAVLEHE